MNTKKLTPPQPASQEGHSRHIPHDPPGLSAQGNIPLNRERDTLYNDISSEHLLAINQFNFGDNLSGKEGLPLYKSDNATLIVGGAS